MSLNEQISKWGPLFVLFNSIGIVLFALGGLILPVGFWEGLNVQSGNVDLLRVMAWYLLVFGIGGLFVWRHPEQQPTVIMLIGLEKIAPALIFPMLTLQHGAHWLVLAVGVFDGLMAVAFILYSLRLRKLN